MTDFERLTATANAPGWDGSAEMLQQRQAAMHALINGTGNAATASAGATQSAEPSYTGGTLDSAGANRGGTLDSAGATMGMEIGRTM
ncbi:MAG TPA: hypothetical protein VNT75_13100 [Symbiobacteriaceae bacterium]|nr:hypothetical protein [Symbiobacteriaceae bacterium]